MNTMLFAIRQCRFRRIAQRLALVAIALIGLAGWSLAAQAQTFPDRPVRIVVPFTPGGAVDVLARVVAEQLAAKWKQSVIVENKPGANQIIGTQNVASSAADGYTLLLATTGHAVNATLIEKLPYDPIADFRAVALAAMAPNILVVNSALPVTTLRQLIDHAKAHPGKLNAAHPGNGTTMHLSLEILKASTGIDFLTVGYKGTAPALNAVLSGEADFMFDVTAAVPHVKAGKLRALAVTSAARSTLLPEVPTFAEAGLPGVEISSWYAFLVPSGTPTALRDRLGRDIEEVLARAPIRQKLGEYGLGVASARKPGEVDEFIRTEVVRWRKVLKDANITAQ
jgi:tripartite-type tricarboxylate transporter receptor subunit TctC